MLAEVQKSIYVVQFKCLSLIMTSTSIFIFWSLLKDSYRNSRFLVGHFYIGIKSIIPMDPALSDTSSQPRYLHLRDFYFSVNYSFVFLQRNSHHLRRQESYEGPATTCFYFLLKRKKEKTALDSNGETFLPIQNQVHHVLI